MIQTFDLCIVEKPSIPPPHPTDLVASHLTEQREKNRVKQSKSEREHRTALQGTCEVSTAWSAAPLLTLKTLLKFVAYISPSPCGSPSSSSILTFKPSLQTFCCASCTSSRRAYWNSPSALSSRTFTGPSMAEEASPFRGEWGCKGEKGRKDERKKRKQTWAQERCVREFWN